ncbi:MAG: exonuclease domain-containing protein, partial [Actinobacteria bacterium]|nr:exonuclease domain-containing protein [Actinomycetota bacterium]
RRSFNSLVNPERDVGPTSIHGLSARDVSTAPTFHEIAGRLIETMDGCSAVAAHNVAFDYSFLRSEFSRMGHLLPEVPLLCTMHLAGGGNLLSTCAEYGIEFAGEAHSAWDDAAAAARLLSVLLQDAPLMLAEMAQLPIIQWPVIHTTGAKLLSRAEVRRSPSNQPTYLVRLLKRKPPILPAGDEASAILAYDALLDRALEDRNIDEIEGDALFDLATRWGISNDQIALANRDYLRRLATAALADGVLSPAEEHDLRQVATQLGIDSSELTSLLEACESQPARILPPSSSQDTGVLEEMAGCRVCFTGECQGYLNGEKITRRMAHKLAEGAGLVIAESVTKKSSFLVVADPFTQSGKARKARQHGIRVIHEMVFWKRLGVEVE